MEKWAEDVFASFGDDEAPAPRSNGKGNGQAAVGQKGPENGPKRAGYLNGSNGAYQHRADGTRSPALISRKASIITPEKVDWLWPGRLARGKQTCFAGEPGTGKSQLSISIIAAITTGGDWPCGEGRAPIGNAIILSAEDGAADTIVPRLMAAGADLDRVHIISAVRNPGRGDNRTFNLQTDIELLERKIAEIGEVGIVNIDPVSSYLGKIDSHKNSEVRSVLEPLSEMADRTRVAILSVTIFPRAEPTILKRRCIGLSARSPSLARRVLPSLLSKIPRTQPAVCSCSPKAIWQRRRRA